MNERREEQIEEISATPSTGNVFADLGLPDAEELLVKSTIALEINHIIGKRRLSQTQAAVVLGIPQPKVSMIQHGKLRGFSLEKLCNLLERKRDNVAKARKWGNSLAVRLPKNGELWIGQHKGC